MAGVRKQPTKGGLWQAWFINAAGKKQFFTARSKTEARRLAPFDTSPQTRRRALSAEEISRFLSTCAPSLRLLYETAFLSGLRANELRKRQAGPGP